MSVVLGIGLSSRATLDEVRALVGEVLHARRLTLHDVALVATRQRFVDDPRLRLGRPVVGFSDGDLERASVPPVRSIGIRSRVAETAALLAASADGSGVAHRLTPVARSPHVTVALAGRDASA